MREAQNLSLFRYPGSKARLIPYVESFIERNVLVGGHIFEPFGGSAIVSLWLLKKKLARHATIVERDPLVYSCLYACKHAPDALSEFVFQRPVDIPEWYRLQPYKQVRCVTDANFLELAWAGIFFNRVNYSGIIGAKPIGGIDQNSKYKMGCRFNRESLISKIYQIHRISHSFDLALGDGIRQLATHYGENSKFDWAYIDPPYFKNGRKFYRYFYNAFDHKRLRDALGQINLPWLLSYDAVDAVRNLYADFQIGEASWLQSAKKAKIVQEILVSNVSLYPSDEQEEFDLETEWPTKKGASGCFYSSLQQSNKTSTS